MLLSSGLKIPYAMKSVEILVNSIPIPYTTDALGYVEVTAQCGNSVTFDSSSLTLESCQSVDNVDTDAINTLAKESHATVTLSK